MLDQLKLIGERLRDQDNVCTSHPVFLVQTKKRTYGMDPKWMRDEEVVWLHHDHFEASAAEAALLDQMSDADQKEMAELKKLPNAPSFDDWELTGYIDTWEYETACFTQAGADEYIRRHRHNLGEARVYVGSEHRNDEWQLIRKFLLSLVDAPKAH